MDLMRQRRNFLKTAALVWAPWPFPSLQAFAKKPPARKLKIGHTCITWGTFPRPGDDATLEPALKDISAEGFWSFETFPEVLDNWDKRGLLTPMIAKYGVPLRSGYITGNLIDPSKRKDEIARITALSKVVQKFNGTFVVLAPNSVKRDSYNFQEHRADIISALNDYAAAVTDLGLGTGLHQHTGTCIESRDEVYAVMESVNTKKLKFAPDVGQLAEGRSGCGEGSKGFSAAGKAHAFEGLQGLGVVLRILPAGHGYGGYSNNPGHDGERRSDQRRHGRAGSLAGWANDTAPDRANDQGLLGEAGI